MHFMHTHKHGVNPSECPICYHFAQIIDFHNQGKSSDLNQEIRETSQEKNK